MSDHPLTEEEMQLLEEKIPELIEVALRRAYENALATRGRVLVVINNELVEVIAEGGHTVIKKLPPSTPVKPGTTFRLKTHTP